MKNEMNIDPEWLLKKAEEEDNCIISVGGFMQRSLNMETTIPVTGIWLRSVNNDTIEVLAEIDGQWTVVISESSCIAENNKLAPISHIVEPSGMLLAKKV